MSQVDLDALEKVYAASTPGEWWAHKYSNYTGWSIFAPDAGCIAERWYSTGRQDEIPRNDLFIVAAHNQLPALIAELRELRVENQDLVGRAMQFVFSRKGDGVYPWQTKQFLFVQRTRVKGEDIPETWELSQDGLHGQPMTLPEALAAARKWEAEHA